MDTRDYLLNLRKSTGMNRKEFCEYFQIPYRTITDWELGNRKMPEYLLHLIEYKVRMEKLVKENDDIDAIPADKEGEGRDYNNY